jgi:hypothetical protein
MADGSSGAVACDHYHRWESDLDLMRILGLSSYRFSVAWPRMLPDGRGRVNRRGLDFYDRLVDGLLNRGITPLTTLYHWDLPQALQAQGGWGNRDSADWFSAYATALFDALGDRVPRWLTINETKIIAQQGYQYGRMAPEGAGGSVTSIDGRSDRASVVAPWHPAARHGHYGVSGHARDRTGDMSEWHARLQGRMILTEHRELGVSDSRGSRKPGLSISMSWSMCIDAGTVKVVVTLSSSARRSWSPCAIAAARRLGLRIGKSYAWTSSTSVFRSSASRTAHRAAASASAESSTPTMITRGDACSGLALAHL